MPSKILLCLLGNKSYFFILINNNVKINSYFNIIIKLKLKNKIYAGVAELADARDLGSRTEWCEGSIPFSRTINFISIKCIIKIHLIDIKKYFYKEYA